MSPFPGAVCVRAVLPFGSERVLWPRPGCEARRACGVREADALGPVGRSGHVVLCLHLSPQLGRAHRVPSRGLPHGPCDRPPLLPPLARSRLATCGKHPCCPLVLQSAWSTGRVAKTGVSGSDGTARNYSAGAARLPSAATHTSSHCCQHRLPGPAFRPALFAGQGGGRYRTLSYL